MLGENGVENPGQTGVEGRQAISKRNEGPQQGRGGEASEERVLDVACAGLVPEQPVDKGHGAG